jgi:hypothetical protein
VPVVEHPVFYALQVVEAQSFVVGKSVSIVVFDIWVLMQMAKSFAIFWGF